MKAPVNRDGPQPSLSAIALVVAAAACFTAIDAVIKYLGQRYSVPVLVWARWCVPAVLIVAVVGPKLCIDLLHTAHFKLHLLRGAVLAVSSLCFFAALKVLPLADATGLNYSTPILVTVLAGWLLRERITWPRWMFVTVGFIGMLFIVRPGGDVLHAASLLALGAAILNAAFQILTRKLADEGMLPLIFYPSLVGAALMSFAIPFFHHELVAVTAWDLVLFIAIGIIGLLGHFLYIQAFQRAAASTIAPFTYTQLVWATLAGWMVFGSFPDRWVTAGMMVIATSAVVLTYYERRRARMYPNEHPAGAWLQSPMILGVPATRLPQVELGSMPTGLASEQLDLGVGQSTAVTSSRGDRRIVIRTD